jgi:hypothetical protein
MTHPLRTTLLVITAVVFLTGCSWTQVFRLTLTVLDKRDGTPISGAKVAVDAYTSNEEGKNDFGPETGLQTDEAGRVDFDFSIPGYTPTASGGGRWYLKVQKDGYEPMVTDIKPNPPPERREGKIPVTVKVEMRRVDNPAR